MILEDTIPVDLYRVAREFGITIDETCLSRLRGLCFWWDQFRIIVDARLSLIERRWVIAHELGHYFHREVGASSGRYVHALDPREIRADDYARKLLMPKDAFHEAVSLYGCDAVVLERVFGAPRRQVEKRSQELFC